MSEICHLNFKKYGEKGRVIVILHGLFGMLDNWNTLAKHLAENYQVYILDQRNHGKSCHTSKMSYDLMMEDLLLFLNEQNLDQINLVGHSMGGKVAMQLALAHSDFVKSLIVVDIAPKPYPLWHQKTLQAIMSVPDESMITRKAVDDYLKTSIEDETERRFMLKNLKRNTDESGFSWRVNLEEISRGYLKIAGFSTALETYEGRTVFIRGNYSQYILQSDNSLIHSLFPQANIISMEKSGHLPHFQQADQFFEHVDLFLK